MRSCSTSSGSASGSRHESYWPDGDATLRNPAVAESPSQVDSAYCAAPGMQSPTVQVLPVWQSCGPVHGNAQVWDVRLQRCVPQLVSAWQGIGIAPVLAGAAVVGVVVAVVVAAGCP